MATNSFKLKKSLNIEPLASPTVNQEGDIAVSSSDNKIKAYLAAATQSVVTEAQSATLTNKTIDADSNTITNIENADIKAAAAIDASKIADGSVSSTEFQYINSLTSNAQTQLDAKLGTTLASANIIVGNGSNVATAVAVTGDIAVTNAGVTSIASGVIVNDDVNASAAIAYSKLDLTTSIVNADVAAAAAIARTKIANGTANHVVINDGSGTLSSEAILAKSRGGVGYDLTTAGIELPEISTPSTPASGFGRVYFKSDNKLYQLNDAGTESQVGAGSGGSKNYITNPDAESDASGWVTFADTSASRPVDGTGGSPASTWARSTSSPLRSTANFLWTKSANDRRGEGVAYDFTIDRADLAKPLQISFDYEIGSGTYSGGTSSTDSDLIAYIYDVTNAALIEPAGIKLDGAVVGVQYRYRGTFQTASNSSSYRLIIYTATTSASAYTVKFDNFLLGPQVTTVGAAESDWASYTPTFTGFGTVASTAMYWKRSGDSLYIKGTWTNGTVTGTEARVSLPSGLVADTNKQGAAISRTGSWSRSFAAATIFTGSVLVEQGASYVTFGTQTSTAHELTKQNANNMTANSETLSLVSDAIPITGWSSNTLVSSDTDVRVVAAAAHRTGGASVTAANIIQFQTVEFDTHGAITTGASWKFTAPVAGIYVVHGSIDADTGTSFTIYKNGSNYKLLGYDNAGANSTYTGTVKLNAGDYIDLRPENTASIGGGTLVSSSSNINIYLISGPSQISATEVVAARSYASATSISGSLATVVWTTSDYDTHGGMVSGLYTVPAAGFYRVSAALAFSGTFALNNTSVIEIQKNSTAVGAITMYAGGIITASDPIISDVIKCVAGDVLRIQASCGATGPAIVSSNTRNFISISRLGGVG